MKQQKEKKDRYDDQNQVQAVIRLIWGLSVMFAGFAGFIGIIIQNVTMVVVGGIADAIDSIFTADLGGILSAIFFALAGTLICFIVSGSPWWYGAAAGLCFESVLGGLIGYGMRLSNFIQKIKEDKNTKRNVKKFLRDLIEAL